MTRKSKFHTALATAAIAVTAFAGAAEASSQSTVSIMGQNGDYYGYVHSSDSTNCESNRKVVVYKQLGATQSPKTCLLYTSPSPRDRTRSRMPSSA